MPELELAEPASDQAQKPIPDFSRLSRAEEGLILKLADDGLTQTEIAHRLGCSQPTVHRVLHEFGDTRQNAKRILNNGAERLAKRIIEKANPMVCLETLDRLEVTEKRAPAGQGKGGITVLIGAQDSVVNVIATYQTHTDSEG